MKRYVLSHLPLALGYGVLVAVIGGKWWPFEWRELLQWSGWIVGVCVGVLILFMDRIAYVYAYPQEQLSQQFLWFVKNKNWGRALSILDTRRAEQEKLTFRSAIFMGVWVLLALFAITSTSGLFGKGVVMGLMLHILSDAWRMQRMNPDGLNRRLFWQIKREFTVEERVVFLFILSAFFGWFSFWVS
ncbi:MAG: hypothetical protein UY18_C0046G0002 [Microgenomates group bacterium GW2011_GWF2_47_9]|nr:MAG: hypothetical protein UY18_C0046G0002 [Microgenomates group bacterium GW2011_GWF2_47_9]